MAKKVKSKPPASSKIRCEPRRAPARPFCGLALLIFSLLWTVAIFDFDLNQFNATNPKDPNLVGRVGAYLGFYGFHFLGVAVFFLPFVWVDWLTLLEAAVSESFIGDPLCICCSDLCGWFG